MQARWIRTLNTVRYLKLSQAFYFVLRRGFRSRHITQSSELEITLRSNDELAFPNENDSLKESTRSFTFLNVTRSFSNAIDWCPSDVNRLWRYNLHYFDYLKSPSTSYEFNASIIDDWIEQNPQGTQPAWEPYTASLRITNWCKFFLQLPQERVPQTWLDSLYEQSMGSVKTSSTIFWPIIFLKICAHFSLQVSL